MPPSLQNVLVNTHGVGEEKINQMRSRKQNIIPTFMAYWLKTSKFIEDFATAGISATNFDRALNELASTDEPLDLDAFAGMKLNGTRNTRNVVSSAKTPLKNDARLLSNGADRDKSNLVLLHGILHVTTDFIGNDGQLTYSHQTQLHNEILSSQPLRIIALFADSRGIGALVTSGDDADENVSKSEASNLKGSSQPTTQSWIERNVRDAKAIPKYGQYRIIDEALLRHNGWKMKVPHITLKVNSGSQAMHIGEAAYEFQQLLLKNMLTLETESESGAFYPHYTTLGSFKAVLFESPVLCHGTYSCSYLRRETPKKYISNDWSKQPRKYGYR